MDTSASQAATTLAKALWDLLQGFHSFPSPVLSPFPSFPKGPPQPMYCTLNFVPASASRENHTAPPRSLDYKSTVYFPKHHREAFLKPKNRPSTHQRPRQNRASDHKVSVLPKSLQGKCYVQASKPLELVQFIFHVQTLQGELRVEARSKHLSSLCLGKNLLAGCIPILKRSRKKEAEKKEQKKKKKISCYPINRESPSERQAAGLP